MALILVETESYFVRPFVNQANRMHVAQPNLLGIRSTIDKYCLEKYSLCHVIYVNKGTR